MTLPEFLSWQDYFRAKNAQASRPPDPATLPELGALGAAGVAHALGGR